MLTEKKIKVAQNNIAEWYEYWEGKVYVAFSGGKDSTALLHLVRSLYPDVRAVYFNTGLEWPETVKMVNEIENVAKIRPKLPFHKIIEKYGYPVVSKQISKKVEGLRKVKDPGSKARQLHWKTIHQLPYKWRFLLAAPFSISAKCCNIMKKEPGHNFVKETGLQPMIGVMAADSRMRKQSWERFGCNAFKKKAGPESRPIMSWRPEDVWEYIHQHNLKYAEIYDKGLRQTGCMFCGYGVHRDEYPNRFQIMKELHSKQYNYIINRLGMGDVLDFIGVPH